MARPKNLIRSLLVKKTFTLSENNVRNLETESQRLGVSMSDVVRRVVDETLGQSRPHK